MTRLIKHASNEDILVSWTEALRLRPFTWAYKKFRPGRSAASGFLAVMTLELLSLVVHALSGGGIPTVWIAVLAVAAAPVAYMASLLPGLLAPADISFRKDGILRKCWGRKEFWRYDELADVTTKAIDWHGERRYLFQFKDARGDVQTILLPFKMDRSNILKIVTQRKLS